MRIQVENKMEAKAVEAVVSKMQKEEMSKGACIRELFAGGLDVKEIAAATGVRYNHVYNVVRNEVIVHDLDVVKDGREAGNSKKAQIVAMLEAGKSITDISKELKCLYNYVWQTAKDRKSVV